MFRVHSLENTRLLGRRATVAPDSFSRARFEDEGRYTQGRRCLPVRAMPSFSFRTAGMVRRRGGAICPPGPIVRSDHHERDRMTRSAAVDYSTPCPLRQPVPPPVRGRTPHRHGGFSSRRTGDFRRFPLTIATVFLRSAVRPTNTGRPSVTCRGLSMPTTRSASRRFSPKLPGSCPFDQTVHSG